MHEREAQKILIKILCAELNGREDSGLASGLTPELLEAVYRLAKAQDLAHVVSDFVYRNGVESGALDDKLQKEAFLSVYRREQLRYAFDEACAALDTASVVYLPLKGSVIRPYYPSEGMRTSCDVDILIHEEDMDTAIGALKARGFERGERSYHEVSLYSPNGVHLELHFSIRENTQALDAVLEDVWQYAAVDKGCRYALSRDFFVFHMYAHMAYHFLAGGCGLRALMDIWVMENRMEAPYSLAEDLLKKSGIHAFAKEMSRLSHVCFSEQEDDAFSELLLQYLYRGGVYGSRENNVAVDQSGRRGTFSYIIRRLFLPYRAMAMIYPSLKKAPVLLPVFWVVRWGDALFKGKSKSMAREIACASNLSEERIQEIRILRSRLEI